MFILFEDEEMLLISCSVTLRMKNVSEVVEKTETHILCSASFFEKRLWDNVEQSRPEMTICHVCVARWVPKATSKHSDYVILNWLSTATMVVQMHFNVMLFVHCLSWYIIFITYQENININSTGKYIVHAPTNALFIKLRKV